MLVPLHHPVPSICVTLLIVLLTTQSQASAQFLNADARVGGMGNASVGSTAIVSGSKNPAAVGAETGLAIAVSASQSFGLADLRFASSAAKYRKGKIGLGVLAQTFGGKTYRDNKYSASLAYSLSLGTTRDILFAVRLVRSAQSFEGYPGKQRLTIDGGLLTELLPGTVFGCSARNLLKMGGIEASDPTTLAAGLSHKTAAAQINVDYEKSTIHPPTTRFGIEVRLVQILFIRSGFATNPGRVTAGLGISVGRISADVAVDMHRKLGMSQGLSLTIR